MMKAEIREPVSHEQRTAQTNHIFRIGIRFVAPCEPLRHPASLFELRRTGPELRVRSKMPFEALAKKGRLRGTFICWRA